MEPVTGIDRWFMKSLALLLVSGAIAAASAAHAQSISVDQPPVALAKRAATKTAASATLVTMKHELSLNWARVTASRDASGKLVAQCTVEPNPGFASARRRAAVNTTTQRRK